MKRILSLVAAVLVGAGAGAGGVLAVTSSHEAAPKVDPPAPATPLPAVLVPLHDRDGVLVQYLQMKATLRVQQAPGDLPQRVPEILDRINFRIWRLPVTTDARTGAVDTRVLKSAIVTATQDVLGQGTRVDVLISELTPA